MNRVLIELGKNHLEYFIDGEVPIIGDVLKLEGEDPVRVSGRIFRFEDCIVKNGKRIRKPTIRLLVVDL